MSVDYNSITGLPSVDFSNLLSINPTIVIVLLVIIILYYFFFASLGNANTSFSYSGNNNTGYKYAGILILAIFFILIIINGFTYFLNIDVISSIKNFFTKKPEIDFKIKKEVKKPKKIDPPDTPEPVPEEKFYKQVYHIPGNKYTYDNAKAICSAYGNRLASYKELKKAYKNGADWCSYGWTDKQLALFPTQYEKWEHLQTIDDHENDCGRPGINGGYIGNPNARFGINCFGYKPKITPEEANLMANTPLYPVSLKEKEFENRVKYWRTKINDVIVSPFNNTKWNSVNIL